MFERRTPHVHHTVLEQVAQLLFVAAYLVVGFLYLGIVELALQVEVTLFSNVSHGQGDVFQFTFDVIDGVYAHFKVFIQLTLRHLQIDAEPRLFHVVAVDIELGKVEDAALVI